MTETKTPINLEQLQIDVGEWSRRNFPNNQPHHPLLGIIEEIGEHGDAKTSEDKADAVADATIFLCDYCARNGVKLKDSIPKNPFRIVSTFARLSHFHLKGEQKIRYAPEIIQKMKEELCQEIIGCLRGMAQMHILDFDAVVSNTWDQVKQRNWSTNPLTAAAAAQQSTI